MIDLRHGALDSCVWGFGERPGVLTLFRYPPELCLSYGVVLSACSTSCFGIQSASRYPFTTNTLRLLGSGVNNSEDSLGIQEDVIARQAAQDTPHYRPRVRNRHRVAQALQLD